MKLPVAMTTSRNPSLSVPTLFLILVGSLSVTVSFAFLTAAPLPHRTRGGKSCEFTSLLSLSSSNSHIDGLLSDDDFDRFCALDETLQNLKEQLPSTLIRPLTTLSATKVYEENLRLTVLVSNPKEEDESTDGEITLLQSRDELISLSDVLVLATSTAQRARTLLSMPGRNAMQKDKDDRSLLNSQVVQCQLALDDTLNCIRIPWKTEIPMLVAGWSTTSNARLEGLSEFLLNNATGKVHTHRLRNVTWNGRNINGPEIGQALRAIQAASDNLQKAPLFPLFENSNNNNGIFWKELRDGILEQAATAAAASSSKNEPQTGPKPPVYYYPVDGIQKIRGWINHGSYNMSSSSVIPLPGDSEWKNYVAAHECLTTFCDQVVPMLAGTDPGKSTAVDPDVFFEPNVTFVSLDGSILMTGSDLVANFYQSLSLARRRTGQRLTVNKSSVLDWRNRSLAIDYKATNTLPPRWNIQGRDMYTLSKSNRPIVQQIQQLDFQANSADGSLFLDSTWLMKFSVDAVKRSYRATGGGGGGGGVNVGEVLSELLLQQSGALGQSSSALASSNSKRNKLSEPAAANVYYLMSSLLEQSSTLFNGKSDQILPPGSEFLQDQMELHGYFDETLVRGRNTYIRVFRTILSGARQSIDQKLLVIEKSSPPRVELTSNGAVRLFLVFHFRLPPPRLLPDAPGVKNTNTQLGVPLKIELVSDYAIDSISGLVTKHTVIETRVNGLLTPGDFLSRWMNRFLKSDIVADDTSYNTNENEDVFRTFTDAMILWFRKQ
jgi:hypothetical protein